ncbi:MAG: xanthine dehydrogenase family protein molybdopterin-binding subunit [Pseudomonadota bacterium]
MRRLERQLAETSQPHLGRRRFIAATATVAGGLMVGFRATSSAAQDEAAGAQASAPNPFEAYIQIDSEHRVTVLSAHMEGGQGIYAGLATLVAEELDADWSQMQATGASGNIALYGNMAMGGAFQLTGGSTAMSSSWQRYRQAGALARALLVSAAAESWGVPASEISVEKGVLAHASGKTGQFGEFVAAAAALPVPAKVKLKDAGQWTYIGNEDLRRPDTARKTRGEQDYTIDVLLPDMLTAVLKRAPRFGATAKSYDADPIMAMPGVVKVVATPRGVAVVAKSYWEALKARDALEVEWDESAAETRSTAGLMEGYRTEADDGSGVLVHTVGDAAGALDDAAEVVSADFEFPYLAHAAMEPLNAVGRLQDGEFEIWAGHQMPDYYQATAAQILGIAPDKVKLHVMMTGGFFGRRATPDADVIVETASIVKAMGEGVAVRVQWSREDDMTGGRYRPMYFHRVSAALDGAGKLSAWRHHIVGQSILKGTVFESALMADGVDSTSVEGVDNMPYAIPNQSVSLSTTDVGIPVLWWRSVGHTHTAYAVETMIDDLARKAGRDAVDFRRDMLRDFPRHLGVLELAAEKAGWSNAPPEGIHRGVALHASFGTYVAEVAEVSVKDDGSWKVERVVCAVDCGTAVNPDVIRAQMEGGIGFALAGIVHGEITLTDGVVDQDNYDSYKVLRINEMPSVEVHIVNSAEAPTGVGEPGVPPLGPAVANALLSATGERKRVLPLGTRV